MTAYTKSYVSTVKRKAFAQDLTLAGEPATYDVFTVVGGVMNGEKSRYWRKLIKLHGDATTNMQASKTEAGGTSGYWSTTRTNRTTGVDDRWYKAAGAPPGGHVSVPVLGFVSTSQAENLAAGAFYSSARNKMSTFKGSVFAAEAKEAKKMMMDRSRRILSSIDPYQRRLKRRWYGKGSKRSRLKLLADSWLELQFGWAPLISDIKDAHKALNNPRPQYSRVVGMGQTPSRISRVVSAYNVGIGNAWVTTTETTMAQVKYYGEVRAYKEPSGAGGLQDFGLHCREFLPTIYEVIPWSFAVDYFTNVGEIVNAISYCSANFSWRAKNIHTYREIRRTADWVLTPDNAVNTYRSNLSLPFESWAKSSSTARFRDVQVEIPSLRWHLPSPRQVLNLAALAVSKRLRLFHV